MKKIIKRRKNFRVNNPLAFGILCAMILILVAGVTYGLAAGIIAPTVRNYQLANATPTPTATPSPTPADTPTPAPSETPADSAEATPGPDGSDAPETTPESAGTGMLSGHVIGIDPARGYSSKVQGVSTKVYANRLNYAVAILVKEKLEAQGAKVVFTLNGVKDDIDSDARAKLLNDGGSELVVRVECNFVNDTGTRGAIVWVPEKHASQGECEKLASSVLNAYINATGLTIAKFNGESIRKKADYPLFTTVTAPVCTLITGYISNSAEDQKLNDAEFQQTMADGIVSGVKNYLGVK